MADIETFLLTKNTKISYTKQLRNSLHDNSGLSIGIQHAHLRFVVIHEPKLDTINILHHFLVVLTEKLT
jgi:hypothetical protein